eukprot:1144763-Pelagomonas_calceolata.AAC.4
METLRPSATIFGQRHHGNRYPYELRIRNKCDWRTVQDKEHIVLDCPSQILTNLRTRFQRLCSSAPQSSASGLRDYLNQAGVLGLAKPVSACLKCCTSFASAKLGKCSYVTLSFNKAVECMSSTNSWKTITRSFIPIRYRA